jgi:hypothetical protein
VLLVVVMSLAVGLSADKTACAATQETNITELRQSMLRFAACAADASGR